MKQKAIFLSASVPVREPFSEDSRPLEIREATVSLVTAVTRRQTLVFGGHPAISPLVEHAARSLGTLKNVHIFQSRHFESDIPEEATRFENFHWTERKADRPSSLLEMRNTMLRSFEFSAAFFIGGMEGIPDEYKIFVELYPKAMVFPVASTGGATAHLWETLADTLDPEIRAMLLNYRRYGALFRRLLAEV